MTWLRLLARVLLAVAVLLAAAVVIVLGPLRDRSTDLVRRQTERLLAAGVRAPVSIGTLRISLLPPTIEADGVVLGDQGALARAAHLRVRLLPRASLREARPVADATADDVFIDVPGWVDLLEDDTPSGTPTAIPPFRLQVRRVGQAKVRIAGEVEPLEVDAAGLTGELAADTLGLLHFGGEVAEAVLRRGAGALSLTRVRGRGGETVQGWRLFAIEASGDGIELVSAEPVADRLPIRGHVELPRLAFASPVFDRMAGTADVEVALVGRLEALAVAGSVRVPDFTFDGERIGTISASADWNLERLAVTAARLEDVGGTAEANGEVAMRAPFAYDAQVSWTALDLARIARLSAQTIKPFDTSGTATLAGTLDPLTVRADATGRFRAVQGGEVLAWSGRGRYADGVGEVELDARQATNTLRGRLALGPQRAVKGSFVASVANPTALGAFLPLESVPNLTGTLSASADLDGTIDDPRVAGQLGGRDVALLGVAMNRLEGGFTLDRTAFRTAGITASLWQGSLLFAGTVGLDAAVDNDWRVEATNVPGDAVVALTYGLTGSVPPIGRGTLGAQVSGKGPWSRVRLAGGATMESFWLSREWIERASVAVDATWPQWTLTAELRNASDQTLTLRGRGTATDDVAIDAHTPGWRLTALQRGELTEMGGTVALDATLRGPLAALSGRGALRASELIVQGRRLGTVDVDAVATRGRWELSSALLDGSLRLRGRLPPGTGGPAVLDADWTDADFGPLLAPDTDIAATSSGRLHASFPLAEPERFDATLTLQAVRVVNGPYELSSVRPSLLECRRGNCTLSELALRGANTDLRVVGTLGASGAVALRLNGEGDLRLLEVAGKTIESARGRFNVDADIRRAGGRWDASGQLQLDQAALDVGAPVAVTRATGRFTLSGTTIQIDQFSGRIGTGTVSVEGAVDLMRGPELQWTLTNVGADFLPSLEAELSGRGGLEGTWEGMRLSGEIQIARLLYDRDIELLDFLPRLNRALAEAPRPSAARVIKLDLHVVAPGELYVENNLARIEARADIRVTGTAERPVLDGRIEALDGTVTFRDREFILQGGTVDFRPDLGLTAALNISLESTIDTPDATYTVDVRVTGTTREPRVRMGSDDPSLSPTDVATLIAVGKTTAQLREGGGGGFSIYDALAAVPGQLSKPIEQGTKQLLPIDRISFESTYSRTTGTFEPQLKLGKDLTDELSVALGQTFGVESRTSVEANYRLTPRVFLQFTWENQTSSAEGAFGGGVKVRYEFWRVTTYTLLRGWR